MADMIGEKLNLKKHKLNGNEHISVRTPADLEIHKGFDQNYYILDFSRLMPCDQITKGRPGSIFYRMFRPEFVARYNKKLCK